MKLGMFLMLGGLIAALMVGPMYMKGPNGRPIMTADDWVPEMLEPPTDLTAQTPAGLYSWVDEHGVAHFSDQKPEHLSEKEIQTLDVGKVMTLPAEAFTGPKQEAIADSGLPEPLRVLLRSQSGGGNTSDSGVPIPQGSESQAAMNDAIAEIAQRFPQIKAMSDELARNMSQPASE